MSGLANETNPWAPGFDEATLLSERAWLNGAIISAVGYGAELVLFCMCFYLLYMQTHKSNLRSSLPILLYVCCIFIFGTLFMGSLAKYTQLAFIDNRNFPGGPSAYENAMFAIPIDRIGNVSFVMANWFCDAVIVWRCMVIYKGCRFPIWVVMFGPLLLYLASFTMGIMWLIQICTTNVFEASSINWTIPFFSLSLSLNILITIAIVARLLVYRHRIANVLGSSHGTQYTSIAAMIVESAAIYSVFSILFLVPFGMNSPISQIFLQALGQVQISSTLLIIFRVASGKGWSTRTNATLTNTNTGTGIRTGASFQMNKVSHVQFRTERSSHTGASSFTAVDTIHVPGGGPAETKDSSRALQSFGSAKNDDDDYEVEEITPRMSRGIKVERDTVSDIDDNSYASNDGYRYKNVARSPV